MAQTTFLPVNWVDGMKMNKSHFAAQDNAMLFQLAQHTSSLLNQLNYGLLPGITETAAPHISVTTDLEKKIIVTLRQCRAITAGGHYIEFNETATVLGDVAFPAVTSKPYSLKELKDKASEFYLVLTINPFQRIPFGRMSQAEQPARTPFTIPYVFIDLVPITELAKNVLGVYQLPVGKLAIDGQRIIVDEEYIPPCTSVNSHPDLLDIHASLEQFYSKMESYALQIIQKVNQKKQINDMSAIVQKLCENILFFSASQLSELKSTGHVQTPVYITTKAAHLARLIKNTLDCYYGSGKEELLNYFNEWGGNNQGELENVIVLLSVHQYNHLDIIASVEQISKFTKLISKLFHQLARLEYVGKRKETGIFVKEEKLGPGNDNTPPKRRSFLAD